MTLLFHKTQSGRMTEAYSRVLVVEQLLPATSICTPLVFDFFHTASINVQCFCVMRGFVFGGIDRHISSSAGKYCDASPSDIACLVGESSTDDETVVAVSDFGQLWPDDFESNASVTQVVMARLQNTIQACVSGGTAVDRVPAVLASTVLGLTVSAISHFQPLVAMCQHSDMRGIQRIESDIRRELHLLTSETITPTELATLLHRRCASMACLAGLLPSLLGDEAVFVLLSTEL